MNKKEEKQRRKLMEELDSLNNKKEKELFKKFEKEQKKARFELVKEFLNKDTQVVNTKADLKLKNKKIHTIRNNSGSFVDRLLISLTNEHEFEITRSPKQYGVKPELFQTTVFYPDEHSVSSEPNSQSVKDIEAELIRVGKLPAPEPEPAEDENSAES